MDKETQELLSRYKFQWADTWEKVKQLVVYCKQTGYFAHDFETSGHIPSHTDGYPTIVSVAFQPYSSYVIPLGHHESPFLKDKEWVKVIEYVGRELVQNARITKVMHNAKFEMQWWAKYGIKCRGVVLDTMLLKYTLNEERPHGLKPLSEIFFPEWSGYSIKGEDTERSREDTIKFWSNQPMNTLAPYCALDSDLCLRLAIILEPKVIEGGFYFLYRNLLEMADYNLAEVEARGYYVDRGYLDGLVESYQDKISELENKMREVPALVRYERRKIKRVKKELLRGLLEDKEALLEQIDEEDDPKVISGLRRKITNLERKYANYAVGQGYTKGDREKMGPVNLKSVKQLIDFLYGKKGLRLPIIRYTEDKKTKKQTDRPSTSEETLLELKNHDKSGFLEALLKYREASKLYSTYIIGIRNQLNPDNTLHGSFLITGTVTGRLSSREPNLQNMPRDTTASDIKYMFVCPPGKVMMQLDYSQAEMRVAAAWSKESTMLEWFRTGHDIHLATACKKLGLEYDDIIKIYQNEDHPEYKYWKKERKAAKCYSGDTQILTPTGWQRLDSYDGESPVAQYNYDTEEITWVKPEAYGKVESVNNYTYETRNISLDITDNHKTLFITRHHKKERKEFKELVGRSGYMPVAGNFNGKWEPENLVRFLAMFTADGSLKGSKGKVRFGFTRKRKVDRCINILNLCNIQYRYYDRRGKYYINIPKRQNEHLYKWLLRYVNVNKELSWDCIGKIPGRVYLDEAQYWDSHYEEKTGNISFMTVVRQTIEVMQAMAHLDGIMAPIRTTIRKKDDTVKYRIGYNLRRDTHLTRVDLSNAKPYTVEGARDMWGVTVPEHNLLVRKDDKVVISGNTIGFGVLYQQGANHLKETLSEPGKPVTKEEAQKFLDEWYATFPKIRGFVKKQQKFAEEHGYVRSPFGRKRRLPWARRRSQDQGKWAKALRDAVNAPIQGTASDFALFSSILIRERIMKGELPSSIEQIGTIHDSIMFYLDPKDMNPKVVKALFDICKNPDTKKYFGFELKGITMKVDFELGLRWSLLKGYKDTEKYEEVYKECYTPNWWETKEIGEQ